MFLLTTSTAVHSLLSRALDERGPGPIEQRIPSALREGTFGDLYLWQWLGLVVLLALAVTVGRALAFASDRLLCRLVARIDARWDDALASPLRPPARFLFAAFLFQISLGLLGLNAIALGAVSRFASILTIAAVAWFASRGVTASSTWLEHRANDAAGVAKNGEFRARGIATQVRVLRRVVNVALWVVAVALMLMQFETVRSVGVSLLASAGLAGVVLGFAAQRTIGGLIAGIQMSATQPIRIGDVVVVEKEWGTIEEITLTFVVVKVWDERRLIVPMTRFFEHPFENWTKNSTELHGTVFFRLDWAFPVAAMRTELDRVLEGHPNWDGRAKSVVVTDAKERALEVRIVVSAADASKLWLLRCDVREKIVTWLQQFEGGRFLPRACEEALSEVASHR